MIEQEAQRNGLGGLSNAEDRCQLTLAAFLGSGPAQEST